MCIGNILKFTSCHRVTMLLWLSFFLVFFFGIFREHCGRVRGYVCNHVYRLIFAIADNQHAVVWRYLHVSRGQQEQEGEWDQSTSK